MKQGGFCVLFGVKTFSCIGLVHIASRAGQSEIVMIVCAAERNWGNVINLKVRIEDIFRRSAIFTLLARAFGHGRVKRVHSGGC